ncbi:MAG: hypothetical protein ILO42_07525 [Clostridia bacterium]|nr:hypothetical protein [Clostridia bacterium]
MAVTFKDAEEYRRKKAEENYNNAGGQTGNTGLPSGGVTLQQAEQYRRQHSESYMQQQHAYRTAQHQKKIAIYNRKVQNYVDAVKQNGYLSQYDTYKKAQSRLDELERFGYNNDMRRTYDPSVYDSSVTGFDTPHKEFEALFDRARQLNAYEHAVVDYSNARNPGYLESYRISNAEGEFDYDPEIWAQEQRKFEEAVAQYRYLQGFENRDAMRARAADLKTQYGDREVRSYTDSDGEYPEVWSEKKKAIAEAARPKYQSELFGSWQEEAAALENYADQLDALDAQEEYNKYKEEHPKEAALGEYVYTNKWSGKSFEERILDVKETAAGGRAVTDYPGVYKNNNELAADLLFYALNNATLDELEKANEDINSRAGSFANFQTDYASWAKLISDYYTDRVGKEYSRQYNVAVNQPDWKDKSAWEGSPDDEFGIGHVLNYVNLRNKNYYGERWGNGDSLADDPAGVNSFGELWGDIKWGLDIGDTASLSDNYGYEPDIIERMPRYQFDMASYLYHTQGAAAAKEYLDYIYENLKSGYSNRWAERYDQMRENAGESSARTAEILFPWDNEARLKGYQAGLKASDAFASVGTAAFAPAAGAEGLGSLAEYYLFGKVPGAGETPINDMRQQIREEVQKLNNFSGGERFAYGTVMSIADCLVTMAVGGAISSAAGMGGTAAKGITGLQKWVNECKDLVLPMMSGQAAVPAFREAKKRGLDDKHAMAMSLAATFAEWVTERIGIETFLSDPSNLALYLGKNVLAEGSEEFLSNALNTLADAIVNGGDSEVRQKKRHYMDEYRLGEKEASWRAFVDWLAEAGLDTLGGAISGAFFGGVGIASTFSDDVRVGRSFNAGKNGVGVTAAEGASENDIRSAGEINRDGNAAVFREILDRFGPESEQGAAAQKALYDLKNGKKISDSRMGKLTRFLAEDMVKKGEVENAGDALDLISMHQNASMLSSALDKVPGVTVTVNGEKTKIIGITGERGARSFTTADGTTVKMNGLDARATDPSARMVLVFADNVDNADVGRIAIENYTPDTDANAYTRGLYAIYKAAIGEVSFNEAVAAAGEYASAVPSDAQHAAYKAGLVEAGKNAGSQTKGGTYDVSTSLITQGKDLSEYSPDRQKSIQNYLNAVDEKLLRFVNNAIQETNKKNLENMHRNFGQILSENIYKKAETLLGFDVSDYQISINGEAVRHIKNGHNGLAGSSDNTMSDNRDIARIGYILANADDVDYAYDQNGNRQFDSQYKGKDNKPSAVLAISKKVDGTYVIGTVAADSKAKTLRIKTAYTTQTQKRSGQESLPENGPRLTSETHLASASADIVSQNGQSVKTDNVERSANPSPQSADADSSPSPASRGKELSGNGASEAKTPPKVKLADLLSKKETRRGAADFDASMRKISDPKVKDLTGKMTPGEKAVFGLFADAFGVDITYLAELPDGAFGEIVSYLRSVKISAESPNPISSAIHEVTHLFRAMDQAMGSDIYDGLRDAALHHLENSGADLDELIDRQLELHEGEKDFDTDDAIEEVVANAYGDAVPNARDFADRLIRFAAEDGYSKKKTKTLLEGVKGYFEKLKKFFSDLLAKTRNALGRTAVTREGIYLQNKVDVCDQMLDAFLDAGKKLNEIYRSYVESDETSPAVTGNVKYQKNEHAIKHVLRENGNALINMSPVAEVVSDGINGMRKGIQVQIVLLDLKQYGKYIEREGFGKILIGENEIKEALSYIHDDAGFAAFKALPGVLKRGTIIDTDIDHKNNGFDTVTIAAPVVINGVRGNMGAIIKKTGKLRYKTHAILMPDGSRFVFEKQNAEFAPGKISAENGNAGLPSNSASNDIVSSENGFVKSKRQIGEDQAALEELERELDGEREKVGRLEKKSEKQEAAIRALSHALAVEPDRIPSYKDLKKLTKDLIESYSSTLDAGKLQSRLSVVCERFRRGLDRKGDFASVYAQVSDIAASIVDSAEAVVGDSPAWEEGYDDFLRRMRNGVRLTETQRQEIGSAYDGFEKWRRDHFGRFNVTSDADATALDEIWDELREYVPSMLPASSEISEGDMALRAAELADRLAERKKETYNPFFYDVFEGGEVKPLTDLDADVERGMAIDGVAQEILSGLADVGDIKTARAAESEGYARARDEFAERLGDLRRETLKERNDWRVAMAADKNAAIEEYRQARKLTELRDKTTRLIKKMSRALLEPTKTVYVPRGLYEASIGALEAIDVGANLTTKAGRQLETLRDRLSYLKQEYDALKASGDPDFMTEYDEHFSDRIARLTDAVGDLPIRKMSYEQLNEVYSLLKEVDGLITDARLQIAAGELMENHDLGMTAVAEMEKAAPKFAAWRNYSGLTLNVVRLANMMGGYDPNSVIVKQVGSLVEGVRKRDLYIMQHTKPFEELEAEAKKYGYKSFDDWRSEAIDVGLVDLDGKAVLLTRSVIFTRSRPAEVSYATMDS